MSDSEVRDANGRFVKGHPGGPGRPRNPIAHAIIDLDIKGTLVAPRLLDVLAKQALEGNLRAAELLLQRVWPVRRNRPIEIPDMPGAESPYMIPEHLRLAVAMMDGDVTPQDAHAAARVFKLLQEQMAATDERSLTISDDGNKP
jgi:hypothetical protein